MSKYLIAIRSFSDSFRSAAVIWIIINVGLVYGFLFIINGLYGANLNSSALKVFWLALTIIIALNLALTFLTKGYMRILFLATVVVTAPAAIAYGFFGVVSVLLNIRPIISAIFGN